MNRRSKAKSEPCPLTTNQQLRLDADRQTAAIQDNFPKGIARPALRALLYAGIHRLDELTRITRQDLLALHGMGPKAVTILEAELHARGLDFRKNSS